MQTTIYGSKFNPYRYFNLEFQEKKMQTGHDDRMVMIKVAQRQHGGSFLRLAWDPGISILDGSVADTKARASFCFREIGCLAEQFLEGLIELLQHRVALLVGSFQEASYVSTLPDHALSGGCFTSYRVVWDPGIIFSFNLAQ
jgi:hypothetical protein